ncbi:MAG: hypothetical protein HY904_16485 [Deltaproteobacteria bacterium]|nr:hypothetical protein [Deltaproteobacteria bacterium]
MAATVAALALLGAARGNNAEDARTAPFLRELPAVDRVEVALLGPRLPRPDSSGASATAPPFPVYPYGDFAQVRAVRVLDAQDAARLAGLWRQQAFAAGQARSCHKPAWGIRFFSGDKLLLETSLSWECRNFYLPGLTDYRWWGLDTATPSAGALRDTLTGLFPSPAYR